MLGVVKRARWPADLEEAKAGGFVMGYTAAGAPIYRNPLTAHFLVLLPNLLALIRCACRVARGPCVQPWRENYVGLSKRLFYT